MLLSSVILVFLNQHSDVKQCPSYLSTYLYHPAVTRQQLPLPSKNALVKKNISKSAATPQSPSTHHSTYSEKKSTAQPLLNLLHEAIANQLDYSAMESKQTGTVKVGFLLYPDGHLEKIIKLVSSGFESIDNSVLAAVESIAPIKEAGQYLKKPESMSVDIIVI